MKLTQGILESVETFKLAILTLVQHMQIAGDIDTSIEDTVTVNLKFESPLTLDQIAVLKDLFTKEKDSDNKDVQLPTEYSNEFSMEGAFINLQSQKITTPIRIPESCTLVSTTDDTSTSPYDSDSSVSLKDFDSASSSDIDYIDNTNSFPYHVISDSVLIESPKLSTKPAIASSEIMENRIKALENMTKNWDILEVYKMHETHERNFPKEQLTWSPCKSCEMKDAEIEVEEEIMQKYQQEMNQMRGLYKLKENIAEIKFVKFEMIHQLHV
ncbi:unnamed protein product [Mytilus edulis]|uniref:Uncharacterized protein n=1 Tax=Mytilus edulis TaxID=6550 RepID=A0A8S3RJA1_MYTED|nr:unnamed protein product [Mytilus edulis]